MTAHRAGPGPVPKVNGPHRVPRQSRKLGMSPGSLVYVGDRIAEHVQVEAYYYADGVELERRVVTDVDELAAFRDRPGTFWVDVNGVHEVELIGRIGKCFGLHPLLLEDIVNAHQRPKFELYGDHLFLVLKMIQHNEESDEIEVEQVSVVLGPRYVITFQERERDTFDPVRRRMEDPATRLRQHGADFVAYALVDTIVDNYFGVLEKLGDRIEEIEDDIIENPDRETLEEIYAIKRILVDLRRAIWPLRDALAAMGRGDTPLVQAATLPYLRDVQDHTLRVIDTIETYRDTAATIVEMYMSSISNRMNDVMRVLTVIATLFIPLTFIVGVYGMNFTHMPELAWPWAYPAIWGVMVAVVLGLLVFFRRRDWL